MKITTGRLAKALRKYYPQGTRNMVKYDVDAGRLKCYPQFSEGGWNFVIPENLPDYLVNTKQIPSEIVREVLNDLGLNFKQLSLFAA